MNNVAQECLSVMSEVEVIEKVKNLFSSHENEETFERYDITFRLFKGRPDRICIETLIMHTVTSKDSNSPSLGAISEGKIISFWSPFGYYECPSSGEDLSGTILGVFEKDMDGVTFPTNESVKEWKALSRLQNALIGGVSAEAMGAIAYGANRFSSNGLHFEIVPAIDGDPQIFLVQSECDGAYDRCMSIFFRNTRVLNFNGAHDSTYMPFRPDDICSAGKIVPLNR